MRGRLLAAILSVTAVAIVLFGVPLAVVFDRFVGENATLQVERQAILASRDVPGDYAQTGDPVELPAGTDQVVLGLYDTTGRLVAGVGPALADPATRLALQNRTTDRRSGALRVVSVPVSADEQVIGAIRAEQPTSVTNGRVWRIAALLMVLAVAVLAVGAVMAAIVSRRLATPVRRLSRAAVQLGGGDFTVAIPSSGIPEVDEANRALVSTATRLEEMLRHERAFAADASHQLRTPLAGLRAAIETELLIPRSDASVILHEALVDIERLEGTIYELLALARSSPSPSASVSLEPLLDQARSVWHGRFAARARPLIIEDEPSSPPVRGRAPLISQALDVLLSNALIHGAGAVRVEQHVGPNTLTLSVSDEGSGFANDGRDLWSPPVADFAGASVHGLGLPMARRFVESLPGRLVVARPGPNPRVDIVLTRADGESRSGELS